MSRPDVRDAHQGARGKRRRPVLRAVLAVLLVFVVVIGVSITRALTAPGTDSTAARLAEWARGHGLSSIVDRLERVTYKPPAVGGTPAPNSPLVRLRPATAAVLPPIVPPASPALPGEGSWHVLASSQGHPVLQVAYLRPDSQHTSYTAAVAWMDTSRLRFVLHPGTQEPGGGHWPVGTRISAAERPNLVAAFNGGFRLDAARGGYYEGGRTAGRLRSGAASFVISTDGRASVGVWGRDVTAGPDVAAVRQNLDLLVDHGQVISGISSNAQGRWGSTLGNKLYVWRSGVGQTASGALVYVAGNRLSAASLADLLQRAGSVRAMELDINPEWTSFIEFPDERNLLPDMQRSPRRYDSTSTRDFFTVLSRTP